MMGALTIIRIMSIMNICTCVTSFVVRVISDGVPILSNSCRENSDTWAKMSSLRGRPSHAACDER